MWRLTNRRGIPVIGVQSITVTDENVILVLPNNVFRFLPENGVAILRLTTTVPEGTTATLPVVAQTSNSFTGTDFTQAITLVGGDPATVADISPVGFYQIFYDKSSNLIQLMTLATA